MNYKDNRTQQKNKQKKTTLYNRTSRPPGLLTIALCLWFLGHNFETNLIAKRPDVGYWLSSVSCLCSVVLSALLCHFHL